MDLNIIYFFYGLSFFTLGIVVLVKVRPLADIKIARTFLWLAAFGITHGIHEWIELLIESEYNVSVFMYTDQVFVAVSFFVLFQFGIEILGIRNRLTLITRSIPGAILFLWFLLYINALNHKDAADFCDVWSRYMLGFPASILVAYVFITRRDEIAETNHLSNKLLLLGLSFAVFSPFVLVANDADFFPASVLTTNTFRNFTGLDVHVPGGICALFITVFTIISLDIFDVLEKKRLALQLYDTNESLIESEERYRMLFEQAGEAIMTMHNPGGKIVNANEAATRMLGYSKNELERLSFKDVMALEIFKESNGKILKHIEKRFNFSLEGTFKAKSGTLLEVEIRGKPLDLKGAKLFQLICRDISERKKTEEALREIGQGVLVSTGDTFFRSLVKHLTKTLGMEYAFIGKLVGEKHEKVQTVAVCAYEEIVENFEYHLANTPCEIVIKKHFCCYPRSVQQQFPGDDMLAKMQIESYMGTLLYYSSDTPMGLLVVLGKKPITNPEILKSTFQIFALRAMAELERKRAEDILRNSETQMRLIMDSLPGLVAYVDFDQRYRFVNKLYEEWRGCCRHEIVGRHLSEVLGEKTYRTIQPHVDKVLKGQEVTYESTEDYPDRKIRYFKANYVPDFDGFSKVKGFFSLVVDITEHKRTEDILRQERSNFLNILETLKDGVYIVDQQYNIEYLNYVLKQEFGPHEGKKCYEYFHDLKGICTWCKNQEVFAGKSVRWEWYSSKNQKTYDLLDTPIVNADGSISKLEIFHDITERKRAEMEHEQFSKKLVESQESERRRIAYEIHDGLGQNILIIKSGIRKCLKSLADKEKAEEILNQISLITQQSIDEVREIISNLHPHQLEQLGLKGAIESVINQSTQSSGIKFLTDLQDIDGLLSKNTEIHIYRIFQESINNIIRHSGATKSHIYMRKNKKYMNIIITDNGKGFIFNSNKLSSVGFGLAGLSERVKILEGDLKIDSFIGKGTDIIIKVPLKKGNK